MAGVTDQGFVAATDDEIKSGLEGGFQTAIGPAVNVATESRNGQQIAAFTDQLSPAWQLGQALFNTLAFPDGVLLDFMSALTGTKRLSATPSTVALTLTGSPTTVVPSGKVAAVNGTTAQFETTQDATIAAAGSWSANTAYALATRVTANGNIYLSTTPGVSAASGTGPSGTGGAIPDGTLQWVCMGAGIGFVDVPADCTVTGPIQGYAGTITIISTPVSGWNGVYNMLDAVPGTNLEGSPQLRVRRAREAAGRASSPLDALRARLLRPLNEGGAGCSSALCFENDTDAVVDGIAPHGTQVLVEGGQDDDVAQCIYRNKVGGTATTGTTSIQVLDSAGNGHTINFSRTTDVDIFLVGTVIIDPLSFPSNGLSQCADAIAAAGNALGQGRDPYARALGASLFATNADGAPLIPGVLDISGFFVGTTSGPSATTVSISVAQHSRFDTSRIALMLAIGST